jgi:hypothetical protein
LGQHVDASSDYANVCFKAPESTRVVTIQVIARAICVMHGLEVNAYWQPLQQQPGVASWPDTV